MYLSNIEFRANAEQVRVVGQAQQLRSQESIEPYFEFPERYRDFVSASADAVAVALLLPAMRVGEPLEIDPPVSELLAFNLPQIRDISNIWYPELPRIDLRLTTRPPERDMHADEIRCALPQDPLSPDMPQRHLFECPYTPRGYVDLDQCKSELGGR